MACAGKAEGWWLLQAGRYGAGRQAAGMVGGRWGVAIQGKDRQKEEGNKGTGRQAC